MPPDKSFGCTKIDDDRPKEMIKLARATQSSVENVEDQKEPFTAVAERVVDLVYLPRTCFCECLVGAGKKADDDDLRFFVS